MLNGALHNFIPTLIGMADDLLQIMMAYKQFNLENSCSHSEDDETQQLDQNYNSSVVRSQYILKKSYPKDNFKTRLEIFS